MLPAIFMFIIGVSLVVGGYAAVALLPGMLERRRLNKRLADVSAPIEALLDGDALVKKPDQGPLPMVDRLASRTSAGSWLATLIAQSGVRTTPSAIVILTLVLGALAALVAHFLLRLWFMPPIAGLVGAFLPTGYLLNRRSARMRRFEEQFPEALDLLSRALRAGHAFQSAMGMVGDELKEPVGPEFKKTFDQQNFGLPLRDSLMQLSDRVPILDVRFFVTAVLIQRETGGNLSEILDNLGRVVRERFKILREVRTHTAHGRFTAFVLLSLPAALAVMLSMISPGHMEPLFTERMGQTLILGAIVMQTIGFIWIKKIIKIEV
jgi:tight adherence protein B